MNYLLHIVILFEIYIILSLSLNLMLGYTGLLTLAHASFYGIGAYVTTLLMVNFGWNILPAIVMAIMASALASLVISYSSVRFKGDYFILATLAFQVITFAILYNWVDVTRGPYGIPGIPKPSLVGIKINSLGSFVVFGALVATSVVFFLVMLMKAPFSRTLKGIRDDELAMKVLGKNTIAMKVKSVAIASACAAVAGALYATYVTYIDPTSFTLNESILLISMVIIGGSGNIRGPIVGAIVLVLLPEALRFLAIPDSVAPNMRMILYGLLLVVLMYKRPEGIWGEYRLQ
jgi:branched-chain amino acid transport system permease protein